MQYVFGYDVIAAEKLLEQLMMCVRQRDLVFFNFFRVIFKFQFLSHISGILTGLGDIN